MLGLLDEKEVYAEIIMSTEDWQWSYLLNKGENGKTLYTPEEAIILAIEYLAENNLIK